MNWQINLSKGTQRFLAKQRIPKEDIFEVIRKTIKKLQGEDTNVERIAKALQFDIDSKRRRMRPEKVIDAVCEVFDVTHKEIKGKSRAAYIALARQVIMYLLREELELPLEKVAREVNRKDHTTVLHACEKIGVIS